MNDFHKFNKTTEEIWRDAIRDKEIVHKRWVREDVFQREYTKLMNKLVSYRKDNTGMGLAQIAVIEFRQNLGIKEEEQEH
jgi:hypothetical protein